MELGDFNGLWRRSATWNKYGYRTTNREYGLKAMKDSSERKNSPARKQTKKEEESPWYTSSKEYGKYEEKVKERLLGGKPKYSDNSKENSMVMSLDRNKVKLPALDHSRYLVAMSPRASMPPAAASRRPSLQPVVKLPEQTAPHSGPAWSYMTNQCGRFLDNMRSVDKGRFSQAPAPPMKSNILTIDPSLHSNEGDHMSSPLPPPDRSKVGSAPLRGDSLTHSIPSCSSGSSLSSSISSSSVHSPENPDKQ